MCAVKKKSFDDQSISYHKGRTTRTQLEQASVRNRSTSLSKVVRKKQDPHKKPGRGRQSATSTEAEENILPNSSDKRSTSSVSDDESISPKIESEQSSSSLEVHEVSDSGLLVKTKREIAAPVELHQSVRRPYHDEIPDARSNRLSLITVVSLSLVFVSVGIYMFWFAADRKQVIKSLDEIWVDHPIENSDFYNIYLRNLKRTFETTGDLTVLTFVVFVSNDEFVAESEKKRFSNLQLDIIRHFLNTSIEVSPIQSTSDMNTLTLERHIKLLRNSVPNLIWVKDFVELPQISLQLLRKYTDDYDTNAEQNLLTVLSFSVEVAPEESASSLISDSKDVLRNSFKDKLLEDEIEPYLARVAQHVIKCHFLKPEQSA